MSTPVKHATQRALFLVWAGIEYAEGIHRIFDQADILISSAGCDRSKVTFGNDEITYLCILEEIPTCPCCAVLYDEAMTAREELLGRKEAA